MKKFVLVALSVLAVSFAASAQPRALGLRAGYGAELSYQHDLGGNFLEADLGFMSNTISLTGIYDFIFANAGICNFYVGPGAHIGMWNSKDSNGNSSLSLSAAVVGQLGVEFQLPIPMNISLDWRPAFYLTNGRGFGWDGFALGLRYRF